MLMVDPLLLVVIGSIKHDKYVEEINFFLK